MELPLPGCSITYIPKDGKKKKHELKITQQGTDPLVLAVQSKEQAEQWLRVSCRCRPGSASALIRVFSSMCQHRLTWTVWSFIAGYSDYFQINHFNLSSKGSLVPICRLLLELSR